MADNYLENRMEQHRLQSSAVKARHTVSGTTASARSPRIGRMIVDFDPELRVFVAAMVISPLLEAIVAEFRKLDAKVDFSCRTDAAASRLAQRCGARYLPMDASVALAECLNYRKGVDVVVAVGDISLDAVPDDAVIVAVDSADERHDGADRPEWRYVSTENLCPEGAAMLTVLNAHPLMKRDNDGL